MAAGPGSRSFARVSTVGRGREPGGRPGRSWLGWGRGSCPGLALAPACAGDTGARRSVSVTAVHSLLAGGLLAFLLPCLRTAALTFTRISPAQAGTPASERPFLTCF